MAHIVLTLGNVAVLCQDFANLIYVKNNTLLCELYGGKA
ncbi:hypothetical protein LEP1GSC047_3458 [Leptospira inadai serovar Lyme str. 10]|uniref:Uncharacterized protein n=1 Tax=Leptospira inadai serovar Lyme str. 10 TaxID=1049790 RepID=V6HXN8_9LEPT|nr:hypothetical protein LEP1GSC047_3458 [Leptospira inadai serovar Lyme str. 10]